MDPGHLTGLSLFLQRSFTLIVEAWDWDNDTTPDGEQAPAGRVAAGRMVPFFHRGLIARVLVLCLLGTKAHASSTSRILCLVSLLLWTPGCSAMVVIL